MELILSKPETIRIPLWLTFACNELRVFGEFSMVTDKIKQMPHDLDDLIKYIIKRINSEFNDDLIVEVSFFKFTKTYNFFNELG